MIEESDNKGIIKKITFLLILSNIYNKKDKEIENLDEIDDK